MVPEPNHQFLLVMSPNEFARVSATAEIVPGISPRDLRVFLRLLFDDQRAGREPDGPLKQQCVHDNSLS